MLSFIPPLPLRSCLLEIPSIDRKLPVESRGMKDIKAFHFSRLFKPLRRDGETIGIMNLLAIAIDAILMSVAF